MEILAVIPEGLRDELRVKTYAEILPMLGDAVRSSRKTREDRQHFGLLDSSILALAKETCAWFSSDPPKGPSLQDARKLIRRAEKELTEVTRYEAERDGAAP